MKKPVVGVLVLTLLLSLLVQISLTACGSSTPTPASPNQITVAVSPAAPTATTAPPLKSGLLTEVFPTLAKLAWDTRSIKIRFGQTDMASRQQGYYTLEQNQGQFKGQMNYRIDSWVYVFRETAADVVIPPDVARSFLEMLSQVPVEEGFYKPKIERTDDYPSLEFQLETGAGQLRFYSASQGTDRTPWGVLFAGRLFTTGSALPARAYEKLEPYLQKEAIAKAQSEMWEAMNNQPTATPRAAVTSTLPAPTHSPTWDTAIVKEKYTITAQQTAAFEIRALAFSPDGKQFAGAIRGGGIKVWETATGKELFSASSGNDYSGVIVFSPDGKLLACSGSGGIIKLFEVAAGRELLVFNQPPIQEYTVSRDISTLAFSPDGKILASGGSTVFLWEIPGGQKIATLDFTEQKFYNLSFSRDGKFLYNSNPDFQAWEVSNGKQTGRLSDYFLPRFSDYARAVSPDGKLLVVAMGTNGTLELWDIATRTKLTTLTDSTTARSFNAVISDNGEILATSGYNYLTLWNLATRQKITTLEAPIRAFALLPDGKSLVTGYQDGSIKVWGIAK